MEFFTDFCREFEEVSICTLGPDFNHDGVVEAAEAVKVTFGEWLPGKRLVQQDSAPKMRLLQISFLSKSVPVCCKIYDP